MLKSELVQNSIPVLKPSAGFKFHLQHHIKSIVDLPNELIELISLFCGKALIIFSGNKKLTILDLNEKQCLNSFLLNEDAMQIIPLRNYRFITRHQRELKWWHFMFDVDINENAKTKLLHTARFEYNIHHAALLSNELLAVSTLNYIEIWNVSRRERVGQVDNGEVVRVMIRMKFDETNEDDDYRVRIVTGDRNGKIRIWSISTKIKHSPAASSSLTTLAHPEMKAFFKVDATFAAHEYPISNLLLCGDPNKTPTRLISVSSIDLKLWDIRNHQNNSDVQCLFQTSVYGNANAGIVELRGGYHPINKRYLVDRIALATGRVENSMLKIIDFTGEDAYSSRMGISEDGIMLMHEIKNAYNQILCVVSEKLYHYSYYRYHRPSSNVTIKWWELPTMYGRASLLQQFDIEYQVNALAMFD